MILDANILKLDSKWRRTVMDICRDIESSDDKYLDSLVVFGSVARNEANSHSDLDVCLDYSCNIMNDDYIIDTSIVGAADIIRKHTSGNTDLLYKPLINEKLVSIIEKDGITVYLRGKQDEPSVS